MASPELLGVEIVISQIQNHRLFRIIYLLPSLLTGIGTEAVVLL